MSQGGTAISAPLLQVAAPLLQVKELQKFFPIRRGFWKRTVGHVRAVDGVSFTLYEGETLGLDAVAFENRPVVFAVLAALFDLRIFQEGFEQFFEFFLF